MAGIPTFLINLDRSTERLSSAKLQLDSIGLEFERVPAIDGRDLPYSELPDYDRSASVTLMGRELTGGEVGCYLSHIKAARRFIDSGQSYGIVFEDDVCLASDFAPALSYIIDWLSLNENRCDLLHLGPMSRKIFTPRYSFLLSNATYQVHSAHYFPMCTHGILWTREGAQRFIADHYRIAMPIDHYFRYWQAKLDRGCMIWPQIASQSPVKSDIDAGGAARGDIPRLPHSKIRQERRNLRNTSYALYHRVKAIVNGKLPEPHTPTRTKPAQD